MSFLTTPATTELVGPFQFNALPVLDKQDIERLAERKLHIAGINALAAQPMQADSDWSIRGAGLEMVIRQYGLKPEELDALSIVEISQESQEVDDKYKFILHDLNQKYPNGISDKADEDFGQEIERLETIMLERIRARRAMPEDARIATINDCRAVQQAIKVAPYYEGEEGAATHTYDTHRRDVFSHYNSGKSRYETEPATDAQVSMWRALAMRHSAPLDAVQMLEAEDADSIRLSHRLFPTPKSEQTTVAAIFKQKQERNGQPLDADTRLYNLADSKRVRSYFQRTLFKDFTTQMSIFSTHLPHATTVAGWERNGQEVFAEMVRHVILQENPAQAQPDVNAVRQRLRGIMSAQWNIPEEKLTDQDLVVFYQELRLFYTPLDTGLSPTRMVEEVLAIPRLTARIQARLADEQAMTPQERAERANQAQERISERRNAAVAQMAR